MNSNQLLPAVEQGGGPTLTDEQRKAIETILTSAQAEVCLAGPAGSGKTTLIKGIQKYLERSGHVCTVVTPTNKAAFVLKSKGVEAATIHSIFFIPVGKKPLRFEPCHSQHGDLPPGKLKFSDVIVVDEASMVPSWIIRHLRSSCDLLVLVGDEHQLPPVGDRACPKGHFVTAHKAAKLTKVHRQAAGSAILDLAEMLREGDLKAESTIRNMAPAISFIDAAREGFQFIAFTNRERSRINYCARRSLGIQSLLPVEGDRMICMANISDQLLNGTELTIRSFKWDGAGPFASIVGELVDGTVVESAMSIHHFFKDQLKGPYADLAGDFYSNFVRHADDDEEETPMAFTFAYCLTAHKAQGSEYPRVCVIDQRNIIKSINEGESPLAAADACRRWIYTAITRASDTLLVAPSWWAVAYEADLFKEAA